MTLRVTLEPGDLFAMGSNVYRRWEGVIDATGAKVSFLVARVELPDGIDEATRSALQEAKLSAAGRLVFDQGGAKDFI